MFDFWTVTSTLTKYGSYVGVAAVFGYATSAVLNHRLSTSLKVPAVTLSIVGILSIGVYFFLQVGAFADSGISGVFDKQLIEILLSTGNGDLLLWRVVGLGYFILFLSLTKTSKPPSKKLLLLILLPSILALVWSFTAVGHVADLSWYWQAFLVVHAYVALSWAGSIGPLVRYLEQAKKDEIHLILERYSVIGSVLVSLLLVAGIALILKLLIFNGNTNAIDYILTLSLKLLLVTVMLGFAAYHKFFLAKRLKQNKIDKADISRSIKKELYVAHLVLLITAGLTTLVGISH